jgi:hypothetical protein
MTRRCRSDEQAAENYDPTGLKQALTCSKIVEGDIKYQKGT